MNTSERVHTFPVMEMFGPTIQGEGYMAGQITHFIRFGGCTYRCKWCDTMYAVEPEEVKKNATKMTPTVIVGQLMTLGPVSCITLTGGDPCIHKHMGKVIEVLREQFPGADIIVETQGAISQPWLTECDFVTLSPKGPSSGMDTDWKKLDQIIWKLKDTDTMFSLKIVLFDKPDIGYALDLRDKYPWAPMALQIGTPLGVGDGDVMSLLRNTILNSTKEIFSILANTKDCKPFFEPPSVRILPQIHTLIWGQKRGK